MTRLSESVEMKKGPVVAVVATLLVAGLAACDGAPTGFADAASLSLGFRAGSGSNGSTGSVVSPDAPGLQPSIEVSGDNDTLTIDNVFLVVDGLKAEAREGDCEGEA